MTKYFNFDRILNHVRRDLVVYKGIFGTTLLVSAGLLFMCCIFGQLWDKNLDSDEFMGAFSFILFISGALLSFSFFKETHNGKAAPLYFTLPISNLERLTAIWLTSAAVYVILFSIMGLVVGGLSIFFGGLFLKADFSFAILFSAKYWQAIKLYIIVQPVFLYGAITFTTNRIGKTLLSIILTIFIFALFNMMAFALLNYGYDVFDGGPIQDRAMEKTESALAGLGKTLFAIILGPVMLVATYFKLLEKQV